jgi:uncharacterized protein (TIGR03083 family)
MNTDNIWAAVDDERRSLHRLLGQLTRPQWRHPSLCEGWQVRDVVAHIVLSSDATLARIALNLLRARGDFNRMSRDTAIRHARTREDDRLLHELNLTVGSRFTAVGTTPIDRLLDLLVHGQDIAVALGITHPMPTAAAQASLERIWHPRFPFRASTRLAGLHLHATDTGWTAGTGSLVEAPVSALLLLATGRTSAALPQLGGDGAELLRNRQAR